MAEQSTSRAVNESGASIAARVFCPSRYEISAGFFGPFWHRRRAFSRPPASTLFVGAAKIPGRFFLGSRYARTRGHSAQSMEALGPSFGAPHNRVTSPRREHFFCRSSRSLRAGARVAPRYGSLIDRCVARSMAHFFRAINRSTQFRRIAREAARSENNEADAHPNVD